MKIVRPVLCLAALAVLAAGASAEAAAKPKPVCNLVTDASGDATGFLVAETTPLPSDAYLDVLSADLASGTKKVTAVIRTAAIGKDSTSLSDYYYFNFSVGSTAYFLAARYDGSAATFSAGDFTGTGGTRHTIGAVTGSVNAAKKTVTITAPLSVFGVSAKAVYSELGVLAQRYIGTPQTGGVTPTADTAGSDRTYKGGTPSCVKV